MLQRCLLALSASVIFLPWVTGCCCCCDTSGSWPPPNFQDGEFVDGDATFDGTIEVSDEMQSATDYSNQALAAKGYGPVHTIALRKDGLNWYTNGTASGLDGGDVTYEVFFVVTQSENEGEIRQTWAAKAVTIDGVQVFP